MPYPVAAARGKVSGVSDTVRPTVAITSTETSPTTAMPVPITITFSEAVTGFEVGDIVAALSGGTVVLSNFAGSGATYTVDAVPSLSNGTMTLDVADGVAIDSAGNTNTVATQFSMAFDNRIVYDTFTGTNGTSIAARSPDIDLAAGGWQLTTGSVVNIQSNRAQGAAAPAYPGNVVWIETNTPDCVITAVVRLDSGANDGIVARFVDRNNMLIIMIQDGTPDNFFIRKWEGGANTELAEAHPTITPGVDYTIRVVLSGNSITAILNGANEINATSAFNNTSTKHGLQLRNTAQIGDDFLVVGNF